jgi:hypothetical protein
VRALRSVGLGAHDDDVRMPAVRDEHLVARCKTRARRMACERHMLHVVPQVCVLGCGMPAIEDLACAQSDRARLHGGAHLSASYRKLVPVQRVRLHLGVLVDVRYKRARGSDLGTVDDVVVAVFLGHLRKASPTWPFKTAVKR